MTRRPNFLVKVLVGSLTLALLGVLFFIKHEVRLLSDRETLLVSEALTLEEENQVLRAEWAFLSRPERVERLAEQHLELAPFTTERIWTLQDLAERDPRGLATEVPNHAGQEVFVIPSFQTIAQETRFTVKEEAN